MNPFVKEVFISTIGVFVGIFVFILGLTILLYVFEEKLIGDDKTVAGGFFVLYFFVIPIGGYIGNKYAVKWFVD